MLNPLLLESGEGTPFDPVQNLHAGIFQDLLYVGNSSDDDNGKDQLHEAETQRTRKERKHRTHLREALCHDNFGRAGSSANQVHKIILNFESSPIAK